MQIAFQEYVDAIDEAATREARLVEHIRARVPEWSMAPVVEALQAMRGVSLITAVMIVAEIGDLTRFENPRQLMAYLGLAPSEHERGPHKRQGQSPRRVTRMSVACWLRVPGPIDYPRESHGSSDCAKRIYPKRYESSPGKHN